MTSSDREGSPPAPGGRARAVVARLLPRRFKAVAASALPRQLPLPGPAAQAPRAARGPAPRVVTLPPAGGRWPPLVLEAPKHLHVPAAAGVGRAWPATSRTRWSASSRCWTRAGPGAVIDVGANVGLYALLAAACSDRDVRAFEPTPDSRRGGARRLRTATSCGSSSRSWRSAVSRARATLFLSDASDSSNSLAEGYRPSSGQLDVPVDTLDAYCARTGVVPAVLKVDTETTEPDVLAGAATTIARHRPWILCEVLHGRRPGELAEVLAPHGYTWYHLRGDAGREPVGHAGRRPRPRRPHVPARARARRRGLLGADGAWRPRSTRPAAARPRSTRHPDAQLEQPQRELTRLARR